MTQTYPTIDGGESSCFITREGGVISLTGDGPRIAGLERITGCPRGVAFGPLKIATPDLTDEDDEDDHTVAAIENLRFAPEEDGGDDDDGWFSDDDDNGNTTAGFLGLALGGTAAADDELELTRRQTIGVAAGAIALGGLTATATADDRERIKFAEFDLVRSDGPVHVGVLDIVDEALPADTEITLSVDGAQRAEWTPADALADASEPNGETILVDDNDRRTVKVYAEGGVGSVAALLAWARGFLASGSELKATIELPREPETLEEGETVTIADHPAFVDTVLDDQGDESVVTLGGESIPHESERWGQTAGHYAAADRALVYQAGTDPPDGRLVELRLRAGRMASMTDATSRLT